jgi:hypothetical protein
MGHEPHSDREHDEQVSQHDELTSIASNKIVARQSDGVKSKNSYENVLHAPNVLKILNRRNR